MTDTEIIALYFDRDEHAIAETQNKYGNYCRYIANSILADKEDAKECENDTYLKIWNSIPPNRPSALKAYVGVLCRNTALDRYEKRNTQGRGGGRIASAIDELEECLPDDREDISDQIALKDMLDRFLFSLSDKEKQIFMRRYWYMLEVKEIADLMHLGENNVKVTLFRTRKKLKEFIEKEGFDR